MRSISLLPRPAQTILLFLWIMTLFSSRADATWSIVICDSETKEVGIASVTCLSQFNLRAITPVVVVGKGAAAVQAAGDFDGIRRPIIRTRFLLGIAPTSMLSTLSQVAGHASRQYGIVDTQGRTATFTGGLNADWAGGVTGDIGTLSYAIQGNILVGPCVVSAVETALLNTPGDLPTKLMAGMQVAKDAGGHALERGLGVGHELLAGRGEDDVSQTGVACIGFAAHHSQLLERCGHARDRRRADIEPFREVDPAEPHPRCPLQMHQKQDLFESEAVHRAELAREAFFQARIGPEQAQDGEKGGVGHGEYIGRYIATCK